MQKHRQRYQCVFSIGALGQATVAAATYFALLRLSPSLAFVLLLLATPTVCAYFHYQAQVLLFTELRWRDVLRQRWQLAGQSLCTILLLLLAGLGVGQVLGTTIMEACASVGGPVGFVVGAGGSLIAILVGVFGCLLAGWPDSQLRPKEWRFARHRLYFRARWRYFFAAYAAAVSGSALAALAAVLTLHQLSPGR